MFSYQAPPQILVLKSEKEQGFKTQLECIRAAKNVADVIRTCLGPRSMLKMLMNPMGGIVLTNDGNAILREITVQHPAAKTMIEISRTQDQEVGDGTTSVVILAGEILSNSKPLLDIGLHPTLLIKAYRAALNDITSIMDEFTEAVDVESKDQLTAAIKSCIGTKIMGKYETLACGLAIKAVKTAYTEQDGRKEIDIKRYARIEKVPGGMIEDSLVLDGLLLNKDVVHPRMARRIENPRILLLDSGLEYKKGESQTDVELSNVNHFSRMLEIEEEYIKDICETIAKFKPDLVITEKGVSDLAQHYLIKSGISCIRRLKKTDNIRVARVSGATIVNQVSEIREQDIGNKVGLFEVRKIGDEYFSYLIDCKEPKACTVLLRGPSKDILQEVERNLQDAMCVCRNILLDPRVVPGGGAIEMNLSKRLVDKSSQICDSTREPYLALARSLEVIPRTLIQNEGGRIVDLNLIDKTIKDSVTVKINVFKTAVEAAILILRIDAIVSGVKKTQK